MSTSHVLFESAGHVAFLTFNRPEARNALTWSMYDALVQACERVDADRSIRVFVLRANGEAFAAGTDIRQFTEFQSGDDGIAYERRLDLVIDRLDRVAIPTIARVHGVAAGGGCAIALACDLRICTPDAQFGMPIARTLGNCLSAANCARLVDLVGPAKAKELLFTGRLVDVREAERLGLVTRLVNPATIDDEIARVAEMLAANAPLTLRATKETLRRLALARRLDAGAIDDLISGCYASHDFREGVAAFLEKRAARFKGD